MDLILIGMDRCWACLRSWFHQLGVSLGDASLPVIVVFSTETLEGVSG
jgi:hypothetical protein